MAPMIVLRDGKPYMVVGSPGGSAIINYVAKTLVGVLDWGLDIQAAISLPNMGSRNRTPSWKGHGAGGVGARAGSDGASAAHHRVSQRHPRHRDRTGRLAGRRGSAPRRPGAGRLGEPRTRPTPCRQLDPLAGLWFQAAQRRRQPAQPGGRARQLDRRAHAPVVALFQQHAAMAGMRMGQGLVHGLHGGGGHAARSSRSASAAASCVASSADRASRKDWRLASRSALAA